MYEHLRDWIISIRRDFHQHPELGFNENRTAKRIVEYLRGMGIEYTEGIANTGVVGIIRGGQEGRTVALRADMDALPMQEAADREYRSKTAGVMYACGHDAHIAILLGAAKALNDEKDSLKGNIICDKVEMHGTIRTMDPGTREMVLKKSPGAYFNLGCRNEDKGIICGLHNCLFDIDEDCLAIGVAMQVENVRSVLM